MRAIRSIARRGLTLLKRAVRGQTTNDPDLAGAFFKLALQYYIAGRSAYFAYSMPVAGNLLHHAVEMLLKSLLAEKGFTDRQLHYRFWHRLRKLWRAAKKSLVDPTLNTYDPVIAKLAPMNELRYPGGGRPGYSFQLSLRKEPTRPATGSATKGLRHYHLSLEDVDELMRALLTKSTTPEWVRGRLTSGDATAQYLRDNFHSFI